MEYGYGADVVDDAVWEPKMYDSPKVWGHTPVSTAGRGRRWAVSEGDADFTMSEYQSVWSDLRGGAFTQASVQVGDVNTFRSR